MLPQKLLPGQKHFSLATILKIFPNGIIMFHQADDRIVRENYKQFEELNSIAQRTPERKSINCNSRF